MGEHNVKNLSEQEFDILLQKDIAQLPPDDIVCAVTPWRKATKRVLTGFALNAITLNFLGLNYFLPAIGMLLILLGFRALRDENRWFRACWVLSLLRSAYVFPALILNTTIYQNAFYHSAAANLLNGIHIALLFALFLCFRKALCAVKEKAGLSPKVDGAVGLILWNAFVCIWALLEIPGDLIIGTLLITAYICIIRSLTKLSKEMEQAGYCICPPSVKFTDKALTLSVILILLIGCTCGYLFFHQYPMQWQPITNAETENTEQIKTHLKSLGFPAHILDDLTQEDLLSCKDALRVIVDTGDFAINNGRRVMETDEEGVIHYYTVYDQKELRITGIGVELAGQQEHWKLFHHFQWLDDPGFYGTELVHLWPAYRMADGWSSESVLSGQLLYDLGDRSYASPYYSLSTETYTASSIFWGSQVSTDIFAEFSMPNKGENHRGYVSYTIKEMRDGYIVDSWINYTHQNAWLQYPAITAKEKHFSIGVRSTYAFKTIQDALQFFPNSP